VRTSKKRYKKRGKPERVLEAVRMSAFALWRKASMRMTHGTSNFKEVTTGRNLPALHIHELHHFFGIAPAASRALRHQFVDARQVFRCQFNISGAMFSSRYLRRLVPGMGTMSSPGAITHASANVPE
jgi:hypothetical protein